MSNTHRMSSEEARIFRPIERGAPGDQAIFSEFKTPEQIELAKRRSQYYGDAFAARESNSSARERISKDSMIMADVKTNVIIQDEYTFITDLSYFLSTRYQRPEASIIVTLQHSACLLFSGTFDPAYTITITALQSQLQTVTNKRNASLIQKHLEDSLGPSPERGLIKFAPIAEGNIATNGNTVAGHIDEMDKDKSEDTSNVRRSMSRNSKAAQRKSIKSLKNMKIGTGNPMSTQNERNTAPSSDGPAAPMPPIPTAKTALDRQADKVQKVGKRKSFIQTIFSGGK